MDVTGYKAWVINKLLKAVCVVDSFSTFVFRMQQVETYDTAYAFIFGNGHNNLFLKQICVNCWTTRTYNATKNSRPYKIGNSSVEPAELFLKIYFFSIELFRGILCTECLPSAGYSPGGFLNQFSLQCFFSVLVIMVRNEE